MIDPTELYNKAMAQAENWADADYVSGLLDDALDTLEGVIIAELKASGQPVSIINKLAKKDERWKEAAQKRREARRDALIERLKYEQVNRYQDNNRTKESTERQLAR